MEKRDFAIGGYFCDTVFKSKEKLSESSPISKYPIARMELGGGSLLREETDSDQRCLDPFGVNFDG